jgi:hypothetical protein
MALRTVCEKAAMTVKTAQSQENSIDYRLVMAGLCPGHDDANRMALPT